MRDTPKGGLEHPWFVELNSAFNRSNWFRYRGLRCAEEKRHWAEKLRQGK